MDFEIKIIEFLQSGRNAFFDLSFQVISMLGSVIGAVVFALLLLRYNRRLCFWYLFTYGFVYLTISILKVVVARTRPFNQSDSILNLGDQVDDYSFPSGHTACATSIAIFLCYFLFSQYKQKSARIWIVTACSLYVLLVALSRMYLGKHYLTDVIGGFALAAMFCILGLLFMRFVQREKEKK